MVPTNDRPQTRDRTDRPLPLHDRYALAVLPAIIQTEQLSDRDLAIRVLDLVDTLLHERSLRCAQAARRRAVDSGLPEEGD